MSGALVLVVILVFAGVFAFAAHAARQRARARTAALGGLAARLGWRFHGEQKYDGFDELFPRFDQFGRGHTRYAHNRLGGRIRMFDTELAAEAGDYHYRITSGSGKNRSTTTYEFSYLLVTLPFGTGLPSLRVRPENFFDKIAGAIGFEDIDFESAEFSRRYHVASGDRRFAYALIDPRMIEFFLDGPLLHFELGGGVLLIASEISAGDSRWEPGAFAGALDWARAFLERWPSHLVTDLRSR